MDWKCSTCGTAPPAPSESTAAGVPCAHAPAPGNRFNEACNRQKRTDVLEKP